MIKNIFFFFFVLFFISSRFYNVKAAEPPEELIIIDINEGSGRVATNGNEVAVHYEGWLYDATIKTHDENTDIEFNLNNLCNAKGKFFDSSIKRGVPFSFKIGEGRVIKGWEEGLLGMREDGRRCLIIPPHLAYGQRSVGGGLIPANSTLIFEIILLGVR